MALTLQPTAKKVLERRYLRRDETGVVSESVEELFRRVAANVASAEISHGASESSRRDWEGTFYDTMSSLRFLPNSPTLMNAGTSIQQLSACFVLPVGDSMEEIFEAVKHTALIHKSGGGTGFSFSRLRPSKDVVRSTNGVSSGPVSFMSVFDAATEAVKQGGRRRGANMAMLRVDHPDIREFIRCKDDVSRFHNFNLSVAITKDFIGALADGRDYALVNPRNGKTVEMIDPRGVFDAIIESAWRTGEPGIVFIDRINESNPTPELGPIESTNPCGEQPLLPYESCNLGSINLSRFARGRAGSATIDMSALVETVGVAVRFLDDVVDVNRYPLPEIEAVTRANRKIGLGVMGFADLLIQMGVPYHDEAAVAIADDIMRTIHEAGRETSRRLAVERGPFPNFPRSIFAARGEPPIRNATVTTIAPTGSISMIAGTSSGIEPLFAIGYVRNVLDGTRLVDVNPLFEEVAREQGFYLEEQLSRVAQCGSAIADETIPEHWRDVFRTAHEIDPESHVRIQAAFQKWTDNAVSKTINFASEATREDIERAYMLAWEKGCKGLTVYRDGSRTGQVLSAGNGKTIAPPVEPAADRHRLPRPRPEQVSGTTRRVGTGCGNMYVTVNRDHSGPFELFAHIGKAGGCAASQTEAIGRLVSLALRAGVDAREIAAQIRGVRCPSPAWNSGQKVFSCADGIAQALFQDIGHKAQDVTTAAAVNADNHAGICMECGAVLEFEGGCVICRSCGFSRC